MKKDKEEVKKEVMPPLTKEKELEIFKALAYKSYKDVGHDFGFHLFMDKKQITAAIFNISRKVRKAPELWGISQDAVEVIEEAIQRRSVKKNPKIRAEVAIINESFRDKLDAIRDDIADILIKKIDKFKKKNGEDEVSLKDLKDLLIMAVDKGRLLRGESTENIVKLSKIDTENWSPEEALKIVSKAREALIEGKK